MKIIIDTKDLYIKSGDLEKQLKQEIIGETVIKLKQEIKEETISLIEQEIKEQILHYINTEVNKIIDDFIKNRDMSHSNSLEFISVKQYITNIFKSRNGWGTPTSQIEKLARQIGTELKQRYDVLFATQIVQKLDKEGLLKDNVAKLLENKT